MSESLTEDSRNTQHATRFTFDLDGPALANYIRDQLEAYLRRTGELPAGLYLDAPDSLRQATGNGEVWIDNDGLPLRLTMHIEYPQQANGERVETDIQTDFSNFPREMLAKADPGSSGVLGRLSVSPPDCRTGHQSPHRPVWGSLWLA